MPLVYCGNKTGQDVETWFGVTSRARVGHGGLCMLLDDRISDESFFSWLSKFSNIKTPATTYDDDRRKDR